MPCRSDYMEPTPRELEETRKLRERTQALADRAVYASDMLREYLLDNLSEKEIMEYVGHGYEMYELVVGIEEENKHNYVSMPEEHIRQAQLEVQVYRELDALATRMEPPTKKQMQTIERQQIDHRKKDLARLLKVLGEAGDVEKLRKVIDADPSKMLQERVGVGERQPLLRDLRGAGVTEKTVLDKMLEVNYRGTNKATEQEEETEDDVRTDH